MLPLKFSDLLRRCYNATNLTSFLYQSSSLDFCLACSQPEAVIRPHFKDRGNLGHVSVCFPKVKTAL